MNTSENDAGDPADVGAHGDGDHRARADQHADGDSNSAHEAALENATVVLAEVKEDLSAKTAAPTPITAPTPTKPPTTIQEFRTIRRQPRGIAEAR